MRTERGMLTGDQVIRDSLTLQGMATGNIVVARGGTFIVHGTVSGDVRNEGGALTIHGIIAGTVTTIVGKTIIKPGAQTGSVIDLRA